MSSKLKSDIIHIPRHLQEAKERDRREDIAGLARNLLTWMVAGTAEPFMSDAKAVGYAASAFKVATEWKDYKDALDKAAEEGSEDNLRDDV